MSAGVATSVANGWLDGLTGLYLKLHIGDPGPAGLLNASGETTRKALSLTAASGGARAATGSLPSWTPWAAGSETITHGSVWNALTGGTFQYSIEFDDGVTVTNGDTLSLAVHAISQSPIAA